MNRTHQLASLIEDAANADPFVGRGRAMLDYTANRAIKRTFAGHDPDQPVAGLFRMRLRTGGVFVGVRIWFGAPHDPVTGEEMDRSHRWQAEANERPTALDRAWPKCAGEPIGREEYAYLVAQQRWGEVNAPDSPQANPAKRINPLTAPTPF